MATSFTQAEQRSAFLKTVQHELGLVLIPEMETTLKVAVYAAAGVSRAEIGRRLNLEDVELKMAFVRLKRIARHWL